MRNEPTANAQANARQLRRDMTDSEHKLWEGLRREQLGVKFRRQHPVGNYIADFASLAPKLIVELDGSQHMEQAEYDARRDAFFRKGLGVGCPHPNLPPEGKEQNIPPFPSMGKE